MRALIRGEEVITEDKWTRFIREHLDWMTGTEKDADGNLMPGDGWTLIEDYVVDENGNMIVSESEPEETFELNGRTYTKAELLELLK